MIINRCFVYRVWNFVTQYSIFLISGALIALVWANLSNQSYHDFVEYVLLKDFIIGYVPADAVAGAGRKLTLHYLVNDVFMALFFAIAGKEVWEAIILRDGSLRGTKALTPLCATAGGMFGPIAVYLGLALFLGSDVYNAVARGWAIPTATDIAFSYLIGRIVFGAAHPAVRFLLLLAIADDAAGLLILAIFYPSGELQPIWLLLSLVSAVLVYFAFNWLPRYLDAGSTNHPISKWVRRYLSFWPYAIAGCLSWYGFQQTGLHPALGLLPIIPAIPHSDHGFGFFDEKEVYATDLLNQIEHALKYPVEIILFLFGLLNAGVAFSAINEATYLVLAGLLLGKPIGILLFGWLAARPMQLGLPAGMRIVDLFVIGCIAAIGFTVALFIASVAFDSGAIQDGAKMGALLSFFACFISILAGKVSGVVRKTN